MTDMRCANRVRPGAWIPVGFVACLLAVPEFVGVPGGDLCAGEPPRPEITEHYHRMLRYHRRMDAQVPEGAVVFLGDSLTQGLCTDGVAQPSVNYGIGSDTTVGVLGRLAAYSDSLGRASAVVLAIGVNDLLFRGNPEIVDNYRRILDALPAGLPVVCSALMPINVRTYAPGTPVSNARITALNRSLREACEARSHCIFVDPRGRLADDDGNLRASLEDGDGIHLNAAGNRIWAEVLREALLRVRRDREEAGSRGNGPDAGARPPAVTTPTPGGNPR